MQILLLTQALCAILLAVSFDTDAKPNGLRIINGNYAKEHEFPFIAFLEIEMYELVHNFPVKSKFNCAGSIITKHHVLTASHCVDSEVISVKPEDVKVYIGVHRQLERRVRNGVRKYQAEELRLHLSHDIALLTISKKIHIDGITSKTICLPHTGWDLTGKKVVTAGWGKTRENGTASDTLKKLTSKVVHSESLLLTDTIEGTGNSGDSGGPVVLKRNGTNFLVGIVNGPRGIKEVDGKIYSHTYNEGHLYRNANVQFHSSWIQKSIKRSSKRFDSPCFGQPDLDFESEDYEYEE